MKGLETGSEVRDGDRAEGRGRGLETGSGAKGRSQGPRDRGQGTGSGAEGHDQGKRRGQGRGPG